MSRPSRFLLAPLALLLAVAGCQAPGPRATLGVQARAAARLTLTLRPAAPYALAYVEARDWEQAVVKLSAGATVVDTQTGTATRAADGSRGASVAFSGLDPGASYDVAVSLVGRDEAGQEVELGTITGSTDALAPGANAVELTGAPTWARRTLPLAGEPAGFVGATVASFPAAGPGTRLRQPGGVAKAADGTLFVADTGNHRILQVAPDGTCTVLAGGAAGYADGGAEAAQFDSPGAMLLVDDQDLYVCDAGNHAVRRIRLTGDGGVQVRTWAGSGQAGDADGRPDGAAPCRLDSPDGLAWDPASGVLYVADTGNHKLKAVQRVGEAITTTTLAGTGQAAYADAMQDPLQAAFSSPRGLFLRQGVLYVADAGNHVLRDVQVDGVAATRVGTAIGVAGAAGGDEGAGANARLNRPIALAGSGDTAYLFDAGNHRLRKLALGGGPGAATVSAYAGSGSTDYADGDVALAGFPGDVALGYLDGILVADGAAERVRQVALESARIEAIVGDGTPGAFTGRTGLPAAIPAGRAAFFGDGAALAADPVTHRLWKIPATGDPTVFSGPARFPAAGYAEGAAGVARFANPMGVVADGDGGFYVCDADNHVVRQVLATGATKLVAGRPGIQGGQDGDALAATFNRPWAIARGADGALYVAENAGHRIRKLAPPTAGSTAALVATTLVGTAAGGFGSDDGAGGPTGTARLKRPLGLGLAADGTLYVADAGNGKIRAVRLDGTTPTVSTVAGSGAASSLDGAALAASFLDLEDLAVAADGAVWALDGSRLRRLSSPGDPGAQVSTPAGGEAGYVDGPGGAARFDNPLGLGVGPSGRLWVCDTGNGWLRVVRP